MEKRRTTDDEFIGRLDTSFDILENLRAEELDRSKLFQTVKSKALKREKERLAERLGADHPRVQQLTSRLAYREKMMVDLEEEAARAKIKVPTVSADKWMVHGVVLDQKRKGKSGLTVGLFDAQGKWHRELGFACTDDNGYFSIVYPPTGNVRVDSSKLPSLFLCVSDQNKILLKDTEPLQLEIGRIYYRRLQLSAAPGVCNAPPWDNGATAPVPDDVWLVQGMVVDESGKGVDGLTVTVYDEDLIFDDRLGSVKTRDGGKYELRYRVQDFRDLIEAKPDLYVQVIDSAGKRLFSHPASTKFEAGRREVLNMTIRKTGAGNLAGT
jgi:hypothetical protein